MVYGEHAPFFLRQICVRVYDDDPSSNAGYSTEWPRSGAARCIDEPDFTDLPIWNVYSLTADGLR